MFPITSHAELKNLKIYKQRLQEYYLFCTIPPDYFSMPPPKLPLPLTPQDLTPRLREIFPFYPRNAEHFKDHIHLLRQEYAFKTLPNDYLINKKRLPTNPISLPLSEQFSFPMEDTDTVKQFLNTIPHYYAIPNPLPLAYTIINYTDKPDLPQEPELITEVNLTLPISTPKKLIIAARALCEYYHFYSIPLE